MSDSMSSVDKRIAQLQANGIVDLHFDLLMDLYGKRDRTDVLVTDFLPEFKAGDVDVLAAAIYIEDQYLPDRALAVGLGQIARLYVERDRSDCFVICKSFSEIRRAREQGKIALLIAMEGIEPIGADLNLLPIFYELGLRIIGLTHARSNAAGSGGVFAPAGSSPKGRTGFGCELVRECEQLGLIFDLAHINPAGFDDILENTIGPVIVSHTNARKYYDIERNISDEQIRMVGARGGVIGINSILVSSKTEDCTLDR